MARKLSSFIDGFMKYTEDRGSPYLFRLWTAISIVAAACERKVWIRTVKGPQYPTQYVVLVGPPGIGKSLCINLAHDLLSNLNAPETPFFLAPSSVTKASLVDALAHAERRVVRPMEIPAVQTFNSLAVVSDEFGVFLPSWESDFMNTLTKMWDCKDYSETRRTKDLKLYLPRTQLSILAATTPAYLTGLLPEGAWETGFMSRTICIYSGEVLNIDIFADMPFEHSQLSSLQSDLAAIHKLWGEIEIAEDAKETVREWARQGGPPIPDHPKLMHYNSRRLAHLLKLTTVACVAQSDDLVIRIDHVAEALDWLVQVESVMPDIFKSMKTSGDARAIEEAWHFAYKIYMKDNEPVAESRLFAFLQERTPAHNVARIIDVMERAHLLQKQFTKAGTAGYVPKKAVA